MWVRSHVLLTIPIYCRKHKPISPGLKTILSLENTRDSSEKYAGQDCRFVEIMWDGTLMSTPPAHTPGSKSLRSVLVALGSQGKFCNALSTPVALRKKEGQRWRESCEDNWARSEVHHPDTTAQGEDSDVPYLNVKTLQDTSVLL